MTNPIDSLIALLIAFPESSINDATIDAFATLLIPICELDAFNLDDAERIILATDHIPTLCAELYDTMRDNNFNDLDLASLS